MGKFSNVLFDTSKAISNIKEKILVTFFGAGSEKKIKALNKNQKNAFVSNIIRSVLDITADKMSEIDTRDIDQSRGSIKKIPNYKSFEAALTKLSTICRNNNYKSEEVNSLIDLRDNILKYEKQFKDSYSTNSKKGKLLYRTCCLNWSYCIALAISKLIDFEETKSGSAKWVVRKNANLGGNFSFKSVKSLNKEFASKSVDEYFKNEEILNESFISIIGLTVASIFFLIWALRTIVAKFYELKKLLRKESLIVAEFLDANAGTIDDKATKERQRALAIRLRKLAVQLAEKDEIANERAEEEISKEAMDKELNSPDNPELSDDSEQEPERASDTDLI